MLLVMVVSGWFILWVMEVVSLFMVEVCVICSRWFCVFCMVVLVVFMFSVR